MGIVSREELEARIAILKEVKTWAQLEASLKHNGGWNPNTAKAIAGERAKYAHLPEMLAVQKFVETSVENSRAGWWARQVQDGQHR